MTRMVRVPGIVMAEDRKSAEVLRFDANRARPAEAPSSAPQSASQSADPAKLALIEKLRLGGYLDLKEG